MNIKTGDMVQGRVIDFTHEGSGVVKVDNFTVFVKGGLIGDLVEAKILGVKKNFGLGEVVKLIEASKDRVQLDFRIEESKGAIPLVEYDYLKQLEWKRNKVIKDLSKIAGLNDLVVKETLGMDYPFRYRNHTQIPVAESKGKLAIGFYEVNTNEIVDMNSSILHGEIGDRIIRIVRRWMDKYNIKPYNKKTRRGVLRHIGVRTNKRGEAMVILVMGSKALLYERELVEELTKENVVSIYENTNKANSSITYGREYRKIYGQDKLEDYMGEYKFYLSPNSFFQVNRSQAEVLYDRTMDYLDLDKDDIVYDLYCGIGTISLYMANRAKKVYGIEIVKEAIEDAKENARVNNIDNVEFIVGKSEEVFPRLLKEGIEANKLVLDPPRKGCEREVLEAIVGLNPEKLVYVSCNPSTMARDLKYLVENGYEVKEVQPVDMFPHTGHVECIALLQREIM